ncbi:MAG: aldehyde dehydrogenase family protein, partial [Chloroflexota bacterium]|nr:aldehyde dehydrogenase family protein [Chloroflexota bacterium]
GERLAERLQVGSVSINDHAYHWGEPGAAWGGIGGSGFGRTHGEFGLMEMVNLKFISTDMRRGTLEPWWYPYDERTTHLLRNSARLLYGPRTRRLWAMLSLLLNPRIWQRLSPASLVATAKEWIRAAGP